LLLEIVFTIYCDIKLNISRSVLFSVPLATAEIFACIYSAVGIILLYLQIVQATNC